MLNCCSASSIMCEYPALRIFSRSRAFFEPLDLLESLGQGELFGVNLGLL